ncbi:hypothetical protein ACFU44_23010 [Nocardia rhizosphaerihabitans]|uniref:hypothetical protein n=1 Tax=Nocardia rhizosphaerihabitans TaxID=1691570 RepID=UPI00366CDCD0
MIEIRIPGAQVRRYLKITRGEGIFGYAVNDSVGSFFAGCAEYLRHLGIDISNVRLISLRSSVGNVETIRFAESCVVYDETMHELYRAIAVAVLENSNKTSSPATLRGGSVPAWANAVYAARYLSAGEKEKALFQAQASFDKYDSMGRSKSGNSPHPHDWATVKVAYAVAHEIAHCHPEESAISVARMFLQRFHAQILPYVRYLDATRPNDVAGMDLAAASRSELEESEPAFKSAYFMGDDDFVELQHLFREFVVPQHGRLLTREEMLNIALADHDGLGEEVLCDALAVLMTVSLLGVKGGTLPMDECLLACYASSKSTAIVRHVDSCIQPTVDSARDIQGVYTDIRESWIRTNLMSIWIASLFHEYNGDRTDLSPSDWIEIGGEKFLRAERRLADRMDDLNRLYARFRSADLAGFIAVETDLWLQRLKPNQLEALGDALKDEAVIYADVLRVLRA